MLRFLIILGLVAYVLYKFASLFFRAGINSQQNRNHVDKRNDGTINVDPASKTKKSGKFEGGEYVDYEEVK
jgi:hypothetical protein